LVLDQASGTGLASCWHDPDRLTLAVTPPDERPYRLAIYLLDYDRNGRAMEAVVRDETGVLDRQMISTAETDRGIYLRWTIRGKVTIELNKKAGFNAVLSGVFVDAPPHQETNGKDVQR
jgi:hypothetical protein